MDRKDSFEIYAEDHPALFDQRTEEIADKIRKADGYIVFVYNQEGDSQNEGGDLSVHGESMIAAVPGVPITLFLSEGARALNISLKEMIQAAIEESERDGETEG